MEADNIAVSRETLADLRAALYRSQQMLTAFRGHLSYTLPTKRGAVTKMAERDAELLDAQGIQTETAIGIALGQVDALA